MTAAEAAHTRCRNCQAFLGNPPGKYCPGCGQETANHPPTFWEFAHEFITHYVALEGSLRVVAQEYRRRRGMQRVIRRKRSAGLEIGEYPRLELFGERDARLPRGFGVLPLAL